MILINKSYNPYMPRNPFENNRFMGFKKFLKKPIKMSKIVDILRSPEKVKFLTFLKEK